METIQFTSLLELTRSNHQNKKSDGPRHRDQGSSALQSSQENKIYNCISGSQVFIWILFVQYGRCDTNWTGRTVLCIVNQSHAHGTSRVTKHSYTKMFPMDSLCTATPSRQKNWRRINLNAFHLCKPDLLFHLIHSFANTPTFCPHLIVVVTGLSLCPLLPLNAASTSATFSYALNYATLHKATY